MHALRMTRRRIALLGAMAALAIAVALAWRVLGGSGVTTAFRTQPSLVTDITQTISANGTLNPVTLVNVGTQVSGTVQTLRADYNDHVVAGQVLLELDPSILRANLKQAEGALANAEASLALARGNARRADAVYAKGYISRQDYDTTQEALHVAQAQVRQAQGQLELARTNLRYSVIRSPVSGVVIQRAVDIGQTVAASFQTPTLFVIAKDLRDMQIDSSFAEADVGQIHAGQPVTFTVDAFPGRVFRATVRQVRLNPTTQQNVVTYDVVVGVSNPDESLMPGMTAYVNVEVAHRTGVLAVPAAALRFKPAGEGAASGETPGGASVYVLVNGRLARRAVTTGISDGKYVQVVKGDLKAGEPVVVGQTLSGDSASSTRGFHMRVF